MRHRRLAPVVSVAALLAVGQVVAGCGGSEKASGTVEKNITIGTSTNETTVASGKTGGGSTGGGGGGGGATTGGGGTSSSAGGGGAAQGDPAAGKKIFASAGCGGCHTLKDAGTNGQVGPNLNDAKPSYDLAIMRVTNGAGAMPSFKGQLSDTDIKNVAAYVSTASKQ